MARISTTQNSHTFGVLDPHAIERRDTKFLQASLSDGANIVLLPQGGYRDRGGTDDYGRCRQAMIEVHTAAIPAITGNASWPYLTSTINLGSFEDISAVDVDGFYCSSGNSSVGILKVKYFDGSTWQEFGSVELSETSNNRRFSFAPGTTLTNAQLWEIEVSGFTDSRDITFGNISFQSETTTKATAIVKDFSYSNDDRYKLVMSAGNIDIFKDGIWQAASAFPIAEENLREVKIESEYATILFFHQTLQTWKLVRQDADDQWQGRSVEFENIPNYDFGDTVYSNGVTAEQGINLTGFSVADDVEITIEGQTTISYRHAFNTADNVILIKQALEGLENVEAGLTVTYDGGADYIVEFTGSGNKDRPWPKMDLLNLTSGSLASVKHITKGVAPGEPVISPSRGWPAVGLFREERLVLMGFPEIPNAFFPSVLGQPFNLSTNLEGVTRAFLYEINAGEKSVIKIVNAMITRTIIIFGEREIIYLNSDLLSPDAAPDFRTSDAPGIKPDTTPIKTDNRILYAQQGGETINLMGFTALEENFNADNASVLSANQINNPVDVSLRRSVTSVDSDIIFIVMENGEMSALTLMRSQEVSGYAPQTTNGDFRSLTTDAAQETWMTVERDNEGVAEYRFEKMNPDGFLDSAITQTHGPATTTIGNLARFNDKEIWVIGDNQPYGPFTVTGGQVVLDAPVTTSIAGYWPTPFATDHAVDLETNSSGPVADKKRVYEAQLSLLKTHSVAIATNGQSAVNLPLFAFDDIQFDAAVLDRAFTGRIEAEGMPGFTREAKLTVTQTFPGRLIMRQVHKRIAA